MELKLDTSIPYALALEGGGAKGAHQIGAWRALKEAGVHIAAVSGTSVGAINGALIAMDCYEKAEALWESISYSQIMDVDDEMMEQLMRGSLRGMDLKNAAAQLAAVVKNRGFDISPLENLLSRTIDEDAIRSSAIEFFIVTCALGSFKELELRAKELEGDGAIVDMLIASAYLPVFRNEKLGGKRYADGGLRDVLPLHVLIENGYQNIIALRLFGFGVERPTRIPRSVSVHAVTPSVDIGSTLEFDAMRSRRNMLAGYYDAKRMLYGLAGTHWYLDSHWSEAQSYRYLLQLIEPYCAAAGRPVSLRERNEVVLPQIARLLDVPKTNYRDLVIACLEAAAETAQLERFHIYTEDTLVQALHTAGVPLLAPETAQSALKRPGPFRRLIRTKSQQK